MTTALKSPQIYLKHNSLGDDIPIVIALKAMGLENDQEIVQYVGTEPDIMDLFSGSLEEPYNLGIYTQEQVTLYLFPFTSSLHSFISKLIDNYDMYLGIEFHWEQGEGRERK